MRSLITELEGYVGEEVLVEEFYQKGKTMLDKGIMPDGERWRDGKPPIQVGTDGVVEISKVKQQGKQPNVLVTFDLKLAPGKPGGGGVTIPAVASNHFFNLAGTDKNVISGMSKAFQEKVKKSTGDINKGLMAWFRKPGNWVWRVVGWQNRDNWTATVKDLRVLNMKVLPPMVDPTRRKWPSGRTEIWAPVNLRIQVPMKSRP